MLKPTKDEDGLDYTASTNTFKLILAHDTGNIYHIKLTHKQPNSLLIYTTSSN